MWNANTGNEIRTRNGPFYSLAWSPNGMYLAAEGAFNQLVSVWNPLTGQIVQTYSPFASDNPGNMMPGASNGHVLEWSPDSTKIASFVSNGFCSIPDITESGGYCPPNEPRSDSVDIWDVASGQRDLSCQNPPNFSEINAVSWSPKKTYIAIGVDNTVQLCDPTTGEAVFTYQSNTGTVLAITWSPDGSSIASGDTSGNIKVWQV